MNDVHTFGAQGTDDIDTINRDDDASVLADLRAELTKAVDTEPLRLVVPQRPNIEVAFEANIEFDLLRTWMKKSTRRVSGKQEFDPLSLAYKVLSFTCRGVWVNGKFATEEGDPITFGSPGFMSMLGSNTPQSSIRALYGMDGHIISTMQTVLERAGYGDMDIEEGDSPL